MTGLEQALVVAVALWLAALTFVLLLVIRQIGLLTVRLSFAAPDVPVDEVGLPLGTAVPPDVLELVDAGSRGRTIVFLSATCGDCRGLATSMRGQDLHDALVVVAGERSLAQTVADLLPEGSRRAFDPVASRVATALGIDTVPFAVRLERGVLHRKVYLRSVADLQPLKQGAGSPAAAPPQADEPPAVVSVNGNGAPTQAKGVSHE